MAYHFQKAERKKFVNPKIYLIKISVKNKVEIKTFSDEGKLSEFVTSRPTLKVFCTERKL